MSDDWKLSDDFDAEVLVGLMTVVTSTIVSLDRLPAHRRTVFSLLQQMPQYEEAALALLPGEAQQTLLRDLLRSLRRDVMEALP